MYRYMNIKDVTLTDEFVREPVDDVCKNLTRENKNIILTGGRGVGKTTILNSSEHKSLGTENLVVFIRFDLAVMNSLTRYEEKFNEHYYEAITSWKLLEYIRKYYALTYSKYFKEYDEKIKEILKDIDVYFNKAWYDDKVSLNRYLKTGEITSEIINKLKIVLGVNTITIAIDRFDWVNGNTGAQQKLISRYFNIFDKAIITSDDETLTPKEVGNRRKLAEKGFTFVDVDYSKDLEILKEIVRRRVNKYNDSINKGFKLYVEIITDEIYNNLIDRCKGNMQLVFDTIVEFKSVLEWNNGNMDFNKAFEACCTEQVNKSLQLKKIISPSRLYL